jgi:hypothetical protein
MTHTLWRLDGIASNMIQDSDRLTEGLRRHLAHADLLTILMQIGDHQQAYVILEGCAGCARGRCDIGCYADLFRRLVCARVGADTFHRVVGGLARRPYTRIVVAAPSQHVQPPDGSMLHPWPEARLFLHWQRSRRQTVTVAALLAVGADGPAPAPALRALGWRPHWLWSLRARGSRALAQSAIPTVLPSGRGWPHAPALLLPACVHADDADIVGAATEPPGAVVPIMP